MSEGKMEYPRLRREQMKNYKIAYIKNRIYELRRDTGKAIEKICSSKFWYFFNYRDEKRYDRICDEMDIIFLEATDKIFLVDMSGQMIIEQIHKLIEDIENKINQESTNHLLPLPRIK
jgi:hypothetical protein